MKQNLLAIFSMIAIATLMLACTTPTALGETPDYSSYGQVSANPDQTDGSDYVPSDNEGYFIATGVTSIVIGTAAGAALGVATGVALATKLTAMGASAAVSGTLGIGAGVLTGAGILISVVMLAFMILSWCT